MLGRSIELRSDCVFANSHIALLSIAQETSRSAVLAQTYLAQACFAPVYVHPVMLCIIAGFSFMTVPIYIAETAPVHLRGRLVAVNQRVITFGQFAASLVNGFFIFKETNGWRLEIIQC